MAELGFYHLTRSSLEQALPRLLERALAAGHRIVLRAATADYLDALDRHLWTYDKAAFLPHGTSADGFPGDQPIWLTTGLERPNDAGVLVLVEAAPLDGFAAYDRVLLLFDGNDPAALAAARAHWRDCRNTGHRLVYWQQGERGGWQMAQEAGPGASPGGSDGTAA